MKESVNFEKIHVHVAGMDIGSRGVFVSIDGEQALTFKTFTSDYRLCCKCLKDNGIVSAVMEAAGVYRMCLYEMPEQAGIKVCPVHPREVQQVKGGKPDPKDSRWIYKLYSAGLLREGIVSEGALKELRMLILDRLDLIETVGGYVNKKQKYLELMNIKFRSVISQIHGAGGLGVVKALLSGERNPEKLLLLCHESIRTKKREDFIKSLEGNYNASYLMLLKENLRLWEERRQSIRNIERLIEKLLEKPNGNNTGIQVTCPGKPARHHQPKIKDLHKTMVQMYGGVNLASITGINDSTMLRPSGETGVDLSRFPTKKHFVSWLGLSPKNKQSGKMKKRVKCPATNAGLIFRQSAQSLLTGKHSATGVLLED